MTPNLRPGDALNDALNDALFVLSNPTCDACGSTVLFSYVTLFAFSVVATL